MTKQPLLSVQKTVKALLLVKKFRGIQLRMFELVNTVH